MEITFTGKTALVTGAGKGIGREIAKLLSKCGARVIALTRSQNDLDTLKEEIPDLRMICVDLANLDEAIKAVEAAGEIDLLVNNAAQVTAKTMLEITQEDIDRSILVNLTAPLRLCQVVAKKHIEKGTSLAIVNISTVGSLFGKLGSCPYAFSKAAMDSMTRALAVELAQQKIRVNCLLPNATKTPLVKMIMDQMPERLEPILASTPIGRVAETEEVANAAVFLLSDKASYITGSCVVCDGAYSVS